MVDSKKIKVNKWWIGVAIVWFTILSTLFVGMPLARFFKDQDIQAAFFLLGMTFVGVTVATYTFKKKAGKWELAIIMGLVALYTMWLLRLGLAERSHLIEYSVLAIFVHRAMMESLQNHLSNLKILVSTFILSFVLGAIDEGFQYFIPQRVFDMEDLVFNAMAILFALLSIQLVKWIRRKSFNSNRSTGTDQQK